MRRDPDVLAVLAWPTPTFLTFTFEGLASSGVAIAVAAPGPATSTGLTHVRLPGRAEPAAALLPGLALDLARLGLTDLRALVSVLRAWRRELRRDTSGARAGRLRTLREYAAIARLRPRVLHIHSEDVAVHYLALARALARPMVTSCRALVNLSPAGMPHGEDLRPSMRQVFEQSDVVHAVSEKVADAVVSLGADPARTVLIRPALDPSFFRASAGAREPSGDLRIVSAGWLRWLKGYEYGLEALRRLLDAGVPARLDVLGDAPPAEVEATSDGERFLHAVEDLGLGSHVRLLGRVTPPEVRSHLDGADVLLHPSLSEGLPNVVIEAMSMGLPVVTTDCGGVREAVRDGVDGFVVGLRDAESLARALERLARDPALRRRMGESARRRVERDFDIASQVERFRELYARVGV